MFLFNIIVPQSVAYSFDESSYCPQVIPDYLIDFVTVYTSTDTSYCPLTLPDETIDYTINYTSTDTSYCPLTLPDETIGTASTITVTGFTPTNGLPLSSITITGTNLNFATGAEIGGTPLENFTIVSNTQATATIPYGAFSGDISVVSNSFEYTITSGTTQFTVDPPEITVSGFTPATGTTPINITITGSGFLYSSGVEINGLPLSNIVVVSDTEITATLDYGTQTGDLEVIRTDGVTYASTTSFSVTPPDLTVSSFSPTSGSVPTTITITGTGFLYSTGAKIGDTVLTDYVVVSDTEVTATIPYGTLDGIVSVVRNDGTLFPKSSGVTDYAVVPPPIVVEGFTPTSGYLPQTITITGSGFLYSGGVRIGNTNLTGYTIVSDTVITAVIPTGATSDQITVLGNSTLSFPPGDVTSPGPSFTAGVPSPDLLFLFDTTSGTFDSSGNGSLLTIYGTSSTSTTQSKYGGRSYYNDTPTSYSIISTSLIASSTDDFTLEMWIHPLQQTTAGNANQTIDNFYIFTLRDKPADAAITIEGTSTTPRVRYFVDGFTATTPDISSVNQWYHVAITRTAGRVRGFLDGLLVFSHLPSSNGIIDFTDIVIGGYYSTNYEDTHNYKGYVDSLRITIGTSLYTTSFDPAIDTGLAY